MSAVFLKILNMSITAGWLILAVILARLLLKRAPKRITCVLWALAAIRLVCPFSLESAFSLIPSGETIPSDIALAQRPAVDAGIAVINDAVNPVIAGSFTPDPASSANPLQIVLPLLALVWLAGIAAFLIYALVSWRKLKKSVSASVPLEGGIMACDEIETPFILGVFRPVIYVPSSMNGETLGHVIRHETAHLKRRDHWWKPLGFLLLAVHWFNPLCWVAYILLCRDIEMACDERVIRDMDRDGMAAYSQALLDCSFPGKSLAACPLAFGEVGVKERVRGVLNYKKPAFWIIVLAVVVCIVLAVCLMTDPFSDQNLSDKLAVSMDMAIAEHNRSDETEGRFAAVDYDVLRVSRSANRTTIYAWVMYEEYSYDGVDVREECGSHIPTAITFDTSDESDASSYEVIEYWEPRDGGYFSEDIRSKFPLAIREKAFDVSGAEWQHANCEQDARAYYGVDISTVPAYEQPEVSRRLTLEEVRALALKGNELTLEDFGPYTYKITGSGLYIRLYPIDSQYDFLIGAASPDGAPIYYYLRNLELDTLIDIRTEDVDAFLQECTANHVHDLSSDGTLASVFSAEYKEGVAGSMRLRTNSERILVRNNADTDIVCLLYDVEYDEPIQTVQIGAGKTGSFTNLTSSHIYRIGIEPVGQEVYLSISD